MNGFLAGALFGLSLTALVTGGSLAFHAWKHRPGSNVRMLARQYQTMTQSADRDIPMTLVAQPELISSRMSFRKIDAIEAELVSDADREVAQKLLKTFFNGPDPWVRARAAKALHRLNPRVAMVELRMLVQDESPYMKLPGIWALSELATSDALELLLPLVESSNDDVQQAVIRCLVQLEAKRQIPVVSQMKVNRLLKELRFKADWIL